MASTESAPSGDVPTFGGDGGGSGNSTEDGPVRIPDAPIDVRPPAIDLPDRLPSTGDLLERGADPSAD